MMFENEPRRDYTTVSIIAALISVNAFLYLLSHNQTFIHIDAIAHVNKARGLFDSHATGLRQLGSIWLPLPHILMAPLAAIDPLWKSGAAGSLINVMAFIGTSLFLFATGYEWTGSRIVGWLAFMLFALNPHLIYLFTTPENEPLMIFTASGLIYYLVRWTRDERWRHLALAGLFAFAATLTRYEGWALAAVACALVLIVTTERRIVATILFTGAAVFGPMLWMLFNMVYFDDPLMFTYGIGSAQLNETGKRFGTAGNLIESCGRYFIDVAYSLNSGVVWLSIGGLAFALFLLVHRNWRPTLIVVAACLAVFGFYVLNLYTDNVSILLPGVAKDDPQSTYNVRYGTVMAATVPLLAALFVFVIWRQVEQRRAVALLMLAPLFLPDPVPALSRQPLSGHLTRNLLYTEAIHNQSFWMPPFIEVSEKLKNEIDAAGDESASILTNTRIVHVVVWTTGIHMRRFITEMDEADWARHLSQPASDVRWVITEEGDQLWHAQGKWLEKNWVEVARAKTEATGTVHLYRRP
jgi:hypothetical protein